jgi:hypothetical protein
MMERLDDLDPVVELLCQMRKKLIAIARSPTAEYSPTTFMLDNVLSNGDIEKELKFLMGATWRDSSRKSHRACTLDKRLFGADLDLVAFEKPFERTSESKPIFWIESKSVFAEAIGRSDNYVREVLNQVGLYSRRIREMHKPTDKELIVYRARVNRDASNDQVRTEINDFRNFLVGVPPYIVHFVTRVPDHTVTDHLPPYIRVKLGLTGRHDVNKLHRAYASAFQTPGAFYRFDFNATEQTKRPMCKELNGKASDLTGTGSRVEVVATKSELGADISAVIVKLG